MTDTSLQKILTVPIDVFFEVLVVRTIDLLKYFRKHSQLNWENGGKEYMAILKLNRHNEKKEIEFELEYLASLTTQQRFELMFRKTREMQR